MRKTDKPECPAGCPGCVSSSSDEGLRGWVAAHDEAAADTLRGPALLARCATAFVLPAVGALAGAILAGEGETRRFVGMAIGLVSAMALAAGVARICRMKTNQTPDVGQPPTQA